VKVPEVTEHPGQSREHWQAAEVDTAPGRPSQFAGKRPADGDADLGLTSHELQEIALAQHLDRRQGRADHGG
jgi:hypothetical protein